MPTSYSTSCSRSIPPAFCSPTFATESCSRSNLLAATSICCQLCLESYGYRHKTRLEGPIGSRLAVSWKKYASSFLARSSLQHRTGYRCDFSGHHKSCAKSIPYRRLCRTCGNGDQAIVLRERTLSSTLHNSLRYHLWSSFLGSGTPKTILFSLNELKLSFNSTIAKFATGTVS